MTNVLDFDDDPLRTIRSGRFRTFRFPAFIGRGVGDLLAPSLPEGEPAPVAGLRDVVAGDRFGDDDSEGSPFDPEEPDRSSIGVENLTDAQLNEALEEISNPPGIAARGFAALGRGLLGAVVPGGSFIAGFFQEARKEALVEEGVRRGNQLARNLNNAAGATGFAGPGFDPGGFDPGPPGPEGVGNLGFGSPEEFDASFSGPGGVGGIGGSTLGGSAGDLGAADADPGDDSGASTGTAGIGGSGGDLGAADADPGDDDPGGGSLGGSAGDVGADDADPGDDPGDDDVGGGFGGPDDEGIGDDDDEDEDGGDESDDTGGGGDTGDHLGTGFVRGPDPSRTGEEVQRTLLEGEAVLNRPLAEAVGPQQIDAANKLALVPGEGNQVGASRLREVIAGGGGGSPEASFTNEVAGGSRFNPVPGAGQDSAFTSPAIQGQEIPGQNGEARLQGAANPNSGLTAPEQAELMVALTPRVMELMARVFDARGQDFPFGQAPGQGSGVPFKGMPPPQPNQAQAASGLRGVSA